MILSRWSVLSALVLSLTLFGSKGHYALADCNCNSGGGSYFPSTVPAAAFPSYTPSMIPPMMNYGGMGLGGMDMIAPPMTSGGSVSGTAIDNGPPPGTLGQTYTRYSKPIDLDEHPRSSEIEISGAQHLELELEGVQKYKGELHPDGIWRFKSERPLIPHIPQIYKVKSVTKDVHGRKVDQNVRYVRMIPGRIVYLAF